LAKESGSETIDSIAAAAAADQPQSQFQVELEDAGTPVTYSTTARVWNSAEEFNLDFAGPLKPTGPSSAKLKIDHRIILSPWAAKRLALQLNQALVRYEQTFGTLEIDARKRMINQPIGGSKA
jgi:hypothetical protein